MPRKTYKAKVVFKILRVGRAGGLSSPHRNTRWKSKSMKAEIETNPWGKSVYGGIHAFRTYERAERHVMEMGNPSWKIFKASIPVGSKYIIGLNGDIVSNHLKVGRLLSKKP